MRLMLAFKFLFATAAYGGTDLANVPQHKLDKADIIILGEVHDNPHHHQLQADFINAIDPTAVVFEMLSAEQAAKVQVTQSTDFGEFAKTIGWADSGWPDFTLYQPIFETLEGRAVHGAAIPRDTVRQAFSDGAAAIFGDGADAYGLNQELPQGQGEMRRDLQFRAHCEAMPMEMMDGMIEAQRLRDAAFARATLAAFDQSQGPVVLIAGNGHARTDWAVPAMISKARPEIKVLSIGFTEKGAGPDQTEMPFDHSIATEPAKRPDPCAEFKKRKD